MLLTGPHDYDISHGTEVGALERSIISSIGGEIVDTPSISKDGDNLSGKFRKGMTVLITDLKFQVCTATCANNIGMGLQDMGWEIALFKVHESKCPSPLEKFVDTMDKASALLKEKIHEGDVTVHIWLSMQFVLGQNAPYMVLVDNHFAVQ